MSAIQCRAFKFLGGPLDGHVEFIVPPIDALLVVKTIALTRQPPWLIRFLRRMLMHPKRKTVSVAVYQLRPCGDEMVYGFLHSDLASDLTQEAGSVRVVDDTIAFVRTVRAHERQPPYTLQK